MFTRLRGDEIFIIYFLCFTFVFVDVVKKL